VFPDLKISFCGGVNAGNVSDVLACGLSPVTVCSDILLPGGYTRLLQYLEQIDPAARTKEPATFLAAYADKVRQDKTYGHRAKSIKTPKPLNEFDCISAPCTGTCPTRQSIPAYLYFTARGENEAALRVILEDNPFPASTGMICDHSCQTACTRINYDEAIRIRDVKRYVAENSGPVRPKISGQYRKLRVSVIGAGPSGLSCAYYLALAGCTVEVFETKNVAGGMLADAIPEFRLSPEALERDIAAIEKTGVRIHKNTRISKESFGQLRGTSDYIYIAAGAQDAVKADIPGCENAAGLLDPLKFLSEIRKRNIPDLGKNIVILGGGNTAIDAARTARRIADPDSTVSIVYRRTRKEMPADPDEIDAALEENIRLIELAAPARVITEKGKVKELECHAMRLEKDGTNARPRPVVLPGRDFTIPADTLIPAFGQQLAVDFVDEALLKPRSGMETQIENVFIGGDAYRGASFLIRAIADGKTVAQEMLARAGAEPSAARESRVPSTREEHHVALSRVVPGIPPRMLDAADRTLDHPAELPLSREEAISEARRCLNCDEICDICISVCPNRANAGYTVEPLTLPLEKVIVSGGSYDAVPDKSFVLEQASQVLNLADLCNECGNCTTFCPSAGRPFADKPRIALSKESFDSLETGYFAGDGYILYKHSGTLYRLDTKKTGSRFSTGNIKIDLDDQFHILNVTFDKSDNAEVSLRPAVSMRIINDAIAQIRQPRNY
ncbi:MAG: FAD-dependent oxidoreductase, partial [Candidatus Marinimicrobia bacterium]|nr:FAD-dependent oxidoreductase [Candidatus Neomarinimicrobiota bacterium]